MIADAPEWNVEAACQVAHAISTNRANIEFDFYTAVDDFQKDDTTGADMMGTVAFNSSCFYRYLVLDTAELEKNLGDGPDAREQAKRSVAAFIEAVVHAIPTGKQNSMAAQNKPSLVLIDVREAADPRSLANAFVEPVRPTAKGDLVTESVRKLAKYAASVDGVYGTKGRKDLSFIALDPDGHLKDVFKTGLPHAQDRGSLEVLVRSASEAVFGAPS
jgi:CRISPR system Cascade subunit CasC